MPEDPVPAIVSLRAPLPVQILRWWWTDQAAGRWAADIQVPGHGLVIAVPGEWLQRHTSQSPVVPKNRRGRVVHDRRESLGQRFGAADPRSQAT